MRTYFITDREEIDEIINSCDICSVGLIDEKGVAYVIPMNFGYMDDTIILHSAPHGKHIDLIEMDNRVCITFCGERHLRFQHPSVACSYSMESKSVMCQGRVEFVEVLEEKERLLCQFMRNYTDRAFQFSAPAIRNVKVWSIKIETMTAKAFGQNFKRSSKK